MFFLEKKFIIAILILILSVTLTFVFLLAPKKNTKTPPAPIPIPTPIKTPEPSNAESSFHGVTPGLSSENDVVSTLGKPIKTEAQANNTIFYYPTTSNFLFVKVYISNSTGKTEYIIQEVVSTEAGSYKNYLAKFPEGPNAKLYGPDTNMFWWYVFSERGIAFYTNETGYLLKVEYFKSMSLADYLGTVAKDLSLSPNPPPPQL